MRTLAIIPARGGSKGLPRKNVRPIAGKPLIAWSIEQALQAQPRMTVLVSTDDEEIRAIALEYGAECPFLRPQEFATDAAPTEPVLEHALDWYARNGLIFDALMLLQPTSPVRLPGTIDAALAQFQNEGADSLLGVVENHHFFWSDVTAPKALYDFRNRPRRQDLTPDQRWYRETGSIYATRTDAFRRSRNRLSGRISMFLMQEEEGWEIDSSTDFAAVEALLSRVGHDHRS
ncbi:MAG TPA: acylneuraminate cytidylyltransferase family protein [Sphingomicrobium sp.]|nr:acylneuraminate cytidylyltransferase family protein [Sphingomicrobium sp.]